MLQNKFSFSRLLTAVFLFAITFCAHSQIVSIADLHKNTSTGEPAGSYATGNVIVQGIVTCGTGVFSDTHLDIYIQDETGGINCFNYGSIPENVKLGDKVRLMGTIEHYNGLTELSDISELSVINSDNPVPDAKVMTCRDINNTFQADYSEPDESRLIRVKNVEISTLGNGLYQIKDSTGTSLLYRDADTGLDIPTGRYHVTGILKQYDTSSPYTDGYEICPRYPSDIIPATGPRFISQPAETDIGQTQVRFVWETLSASTAELKWGKTPDCAQGSTAGQTATRHDLTITSLDPGTLYYGQAFCSDSTGTSESGLFLFNTASAQASGTMHVYFTQSVDTTLALNTAACGDQDISTQLIERIDAAQYSIDMCMYSFTHTSVMSALLNAHARGVKLRCIVEAENWGNIHDRLELHGITVITDEFGNNDGDGYMHDKFFIFDHRDSTSRTDDWIWTGSANASYYGLDLAAENAIEINDDVLCRAYTREFNEMWGTRGDTPNADSSRFGSRKRDNTPHRFSIGGKWVELYMSPSDQSERHIINTIQSAEKSIDFCIFSFTSNGIENALRDRFLNVPGFTLRGVFERDNINHWGAAWPPMSGDGDYAWTQIPDIHLDGEERSLHHKYMLCDAAFPGHQPAVITGSHNWSISANTRNDENVLIIQDADIANQYYQEFIERYRQAGGSSPLTGVRENPGPRQNSVQNPALSQPL
ncbi:MAG: phospholipase D-like domain-containing protein [candidate division KSB1 bacterium]|nr:phospholipase D-like domain-containing protein [candidate division KSB1 bacterium]